MKLLDDAALGKFDVLLCTDLTPLTRRLSPEIIMAIRDAGVKMLAVDRGENDKYEQSNGEAT